ncbi:DUF2190 family protein [Paracoccus sp. MBLB3053]|uniref:DUF2190 family protein n=1 Tax=Paracoccus aurantius TaxID=3073814 RepID=A0ABU2HS30_9RHOB|nr:DUF2190 family protein [Paracoccus sp. MBLB3053]MDS9467345.1 DUF2190 family protein [Paracoccus sp. MBLB3053]
MAKNYLQAGEFVTVLAPAALASGDPVLVGAIFGVVQFDADSGDEVELARRGIFDLPKTTGQAWTAGVKVYWDATNSLVTTTASGNTLIGAATAARVAGDTTGTVLLDGTIR